MAQHEMRAMRGMPLRVRSMEGLGLGSFATAPLWGRFVLLFVSNTCTRFTAPLLVSTHSNVNGGLQCTLSSLR